ncbi:MULTISPECIES: hypothetical protein [unclassified Streptomyces]|uniref:hypothetical protein n=1 Tax=unclassified Streptomyces TaxID=2593676 RepID=UPI0027E3E358|nr:MULTISPECIES: hypothetical protein [unclassified Streptomyces]
MSGEMTLGAVLARLEEREREIAAQAEATWEKVTELLNGLDNAAEEIRITRKTLLELPGPQPPLPPAPQLPDHPAYQQIMAVFTKADTPLRARAVCEALDLEVPASTVNNTRLKLKRLVKRGILTETEQGLFAPATAIAAGQTHGRSLSPEDAKRATTRLPPTEVEACSSIAATSGLASPSGQQPSGRPEHPLRVRQMVFTTCEVG